MSLDPAAHFAQFIRPEENIMDFTPDYTKNLDSDPLAWGLKVVAKLQQPDQSYSFDEYQVWIDRDGALYFAHTSGCSCPTPYEEYTHISELRTLRNGNYYQFSGEVSRWFNGNIGERLAFLTKISAALNDPSSAALSDADLEAEQQRKATEKFRNQVLGGLRECQRQLAELPYSTSYLSNPAQLADVVEELQEIKTTDILVLGVYLTRMAEDALAAHAEKQADAGDAQAQFDGDR